MTISEEVKNMCPVAKGPHHGPAPCLDGFVVQS